MAQQLLFGQRLIIIEALRSHSDIPTSVGLLWTGDQPDQEMKGNEFICGIQHRPEADKSHSVIINTDQKLVSPTQLSSTLIRS